MQERGHEEKASSPMAWHCDALRKGMNFTIEDAFAFDSRRVPHRLGDGVVPIRILVLARGGGRGLLQVLAVAPRFKYLLAQARRRR